MSSATAAPRTILENRVPNRPEVEHDPGDDRNAGDRERGGEDDYKRRMVVCRSLERVEIEDQRGGHTPTDERVAVASRV